MQESEPISTRTTGETLTGLLTSALPIVGAAVIANQQSKATNNTALNTAQQQATAAQQAAALQQQQAQASANLTKIALVGAGVLVAGLVLVVAIRK